MAIKPGAGTTPEPVPLRGVIPIVVTAFSADGSVDLDQMEKQLEFLIARGVQWVGFGFGSEVNRLSLSSLSATVRHVVRVAGGRVGVIGNAEMTSIERGLDEARRAKECGADLAMVRPSGLVGVSQESLFEAFAAVASASPIPLVVQDAPQSTGVELSPATLARLAGLPNVAALKVEPLNPARKMSLIREHLGGGRGTLIGGAGGVDYIHELQRGAVATMPGPAYPELFAAIERNHWKGERGQALALLSRALPLMCLGKRDLDTFLFVQKYVLLRRGVFSSTLLGRPHGDLDPRLPAEIDELLDQMGLLELFEECGPTP
jgi:dihydrodipicolinate synthase/N-acetylneuraminate lyase